MALRSVPTASATQAPPLAQRAQGLAPTLLVSFAGDAASDNLVRALKALAGPWTPEGSGGNLWRQGNTLLWELEESPLAADDLDMRFKELTGMQRATWS